MNIGIFTYGTRGDLQPYIALALGLMNNGHKVTISATEDFKDFVENFGVGFQPLFGNAETMMNTAEGKSILQTENSIALMKYYFKVLHNNRVALRKSYFNAITKVDYIIANSMTLPIVAAIAEKQKKKMALTYFMPPVVATSEFPVADFDFLNFGWYNKFTYRLAHYFFWKFIEKDTNEYRKELGLEKLNKNIIHHLDQQKILDIYCISPSLIPQPKDWEPHHKITGFINIPKEKRETTSIEKPTAELENWLTNGTSPIYIGFGSNGVGNSQKFVSLIQAILRETNERILFCTGWGVFNNLPQHKNLFVTKYINHEAILPKCKLGIFHGGAGTLATMLRNELPVIIISFYTDQPTWGKIVEKLELGIHIPVKKLNEEKLLRAILKVQHQKIKKNVVKMGAKIRSENGLENAITEIENYFLNN